MTNAGMPERKGSPTPGRGGPASRVGPEGYVSAGVQFPLPEKAFRPDL